MAPQPTAYNPSPSNGPLFSRAPTPEDKEFPLGYLWIKYPTAPSAAPALFVCVGQGEWVIVPVQGHVTQTSGG